jgi:DNA-directed RNA polymerase beta subunit
MAGNIRNIFTSPSEVEDLAKKELLQGIASQFPVENKDFRLEIANVFVEDRPVTKEEEKRALLTSSSLIRPVKGDLSLIDKRTGKVVDQITNFSLADFYKLTDKHTMVYQGNNYSMASLIQLMPGVYTRHKKDGNLEAQINTGSGRSLSIQMDPEKGLFTLMAAGSKAQVPLLPVLKEVYGISDTEATKYIPRDIWAMDAAAVGQKKWDSAIDSLYGLVVDRSTQNKDSGREEKKLAIREAFSRSQLSPVTTSITLGKEKTNVDSEVFLKAMKNMVDVHRGDREEDNRDSLEFKRVQGLPDFIRERFRKNDESVKKVGDRLTFRLERIDKENPKISGVIGAKPFKDLYSSIIVRSNLSSTPTETNPLESLENVGKVTAIGAGEGGMSDSRMADLNTKNIHPSHLGIIDPSRTPESGTAGLDQRFTMSAMRDEDGILYASVVDAKTGKKTELSAQQMMKAIIGFPHQKGPKVYAQVRGQVKEVLRNEVQYWLPEATSMYTVTTNLVPFLNSNHPGRLTMAGKALTQALSLEDRDIPLVQTMSPSGNSLVKDLGSILSTLSPVDGTVESISNERIVIKDAKGTRHTVDLIKDMPFNAKGFHDDTPTVKVGTRVKQHQVVADNTYTKDGHLALGRNMTTAYMAYKGYNHEDGIVISRSASRKLNSNHAYKYDYSLKRTTETNLPLFKRYYPQEFTHEQLAKLDDRGFVKKGTRLVYGDPIFALLEPNNPSAEDKALGRLHKSLVDPFRRVVEVWEHEEPGEVVETHTSSKDILIMVKSVKPLEVGDKLTGLHGNKGVVSLILDDEHMPRVKETGAPVDMLLNPASVTSRVNLGQVLETAAAKIAQKTGKPYIVQNFAEENSVKKLKKELHKLNLKDTETLVDPDSGKVLGEVLTGPQYILKLSKTTDQNYSARNVGKYDQFLQPVKGGEEGAKSIGFMEFLGLIGSDARHNLREMGTVKSEKNEEYWHKFMTGQPLPKPRTTFATKRFFDQLRGAGVTVKTQDGVIQAAPLTDEDVLARSSGKIKKPLLLSSKGAVPEKGGFFDMATTGGLTGGKWSHYTLAEPIINPVFEGPVRNILGLKEKEFDSIVSGEVHVQRRQKGVFDLFDGSTQSFLKTIDTRPGFSKTAAAKGEKEPAPVYKGEGYLVGGPAFKEMLNSIDIDATLKADRTKFTETRAADKKNDIVKRMKYLHGLKENGFDDPSKAYLLHNVPVIPPVMRPVIDQGGNRLQFADVNMLYQDSFAANNTFKSLKDILTDDMLVEQRRSNYGAVKAIMGVGEAISFKHRKAGLTGLMEAISGRDTPKHGMMMEKILKKKQDFSGRGTIYADPTLDFNEAAIPEDQLWTMYKMHIIRNLGQHGFSPVEAKRAYDEKQLPAVHAFNKLIKEVPVILNRAPTLMQTNIMALLPRPTKGNTIGLNILHLPAYAADYDGDALSMFVPMTPEAVREANEKMLPMRHLNDARLGYGIPMFAPGHEAILGSVHLTEPDMQQKVVKFKTEADALSALKRGDIQDNTPIEIGA